jgi:hypothetical protein
LVRLEVAGVCFAVVLAACGGGSLTLSEYAAEAEELVAVMAAEFVALDAEWESQPPRLEGARTYWEGRLAVRAEFLEGVRALNPPDAVEAQHEAALDVFGRITAADEALAARVATFESITGHWEWVDTPEGKAADAVLEEVFAFCRASQAEFDATKDREALVDVPWLPSEASEVVSVAFGCPP